MSQTTHAIVLREHGGPDKLLWEERPVGKPGPGQARIRQTAIGVNFIDVYNRTGLYPLALPEVLGQEAAGVVLETGAGVGLQPGDRVAYAGVQGAYCEERLVPADRLVPIPAKVGDAEAAAVIFKGLTAEMLLRRVRPVARGEAILFNAAAGGVGQIAVGWARALGATVIGTVGSKAKVGAAQAAGCHHVLVTDGEGVRTLPARVRELTSGAGVRVAYDSVGGELLNASLDCVAVRGMLVSFGQSSGKVPLIDTGRLVSRGSLYLCRPSIRHYLADPKELQAAAAAVFGALLAGHFKAQAGQRFALQDAARAHAELEARRTTGATLLMPGQSSRD